MLTASIYHLPTSLYVMILSLTIPWGGGAHPCYIFLRIKGSFLGPPHVRDLVKEGYFFVPRYDVWW